MKTMASAEFRNVVLCLGCWLIGVVSSAGQPVTQIAAGAGSWHSLFLKGDGSLWGMGYNPFGQLGDGTTNNVGYPELIMASEVKAFSAAKHALILKNDGSLWVTGLNTSGQLGVGTFSPYTNNGIDRRVRAYLVSQE